MSHDGTANQQYLNKIQSLQVVIFMITRSVNQWSVRGGGSALIFAGSFQIKNSSFDGLSLNIQALWVCEGHTLWNQQKIRSVSVEISYNKVWFHLWVRKYYIIPRSLFQYKDALLPV